MFPRTMLILSLVTFGSLSGTSLAQFDRGRDGGRDSGGMSDRFFGMMDRNQDGRLDGDELERMPGPFRDALSRMRVDMRRGLSASDFANVMPRVMEEVRNSGGFGPPGGFGGDRGSFGGGFGPPGGFGGGFGPPGGFGDRGGDDRGGDRGDSRGSDRGRDSRGGDDRGRGRSSSSAPAPRPRVTVDLPENWKPADADGDGQIGFYEWERAKLTEFLAVDENGDGYLTPAEISRASGAQPMPRSSAPSAYVAAVAGSSPPAGPAPGSFGGPAPRSFGPSGPPPGPPSAAAPPAAPRAPIQPAEYDKESSEARWASYAFKRLDTDKDGGLSEAEWEASKSTRQSFEKYAAQIRFPVDVDQFTGLLVAIQREEKKQ